MLPLCTVVRLDDAPRQKLRGSECLVRRCRQVALNVAKRATVGVELVHVFGKNDHRFRVGLFMQFGGSLVVIHKLPHSVPNNLKSSLRGTSNLPRKARQTFNLLR